MNSKILILDCQNASTATSGGAGVYIDKLARYLSANSSTLGFNVQIENPASDHAAKKLRSKIRDIAQIALPPKGYDLLLELYRLSRAKKTAEHELKLKGLTSSHEKVIAHELTNYWIYPRFAKERIKGNVRLLTTFLDIQDFYYPDFFSEDDLMGRRKNYLFYKEYCHHFIAISEFTKSTMIDCLSIAPEKITVVPLASETLPPTQDLSFEDKIKKLGRYIIYPAKLWAHKNHKTLFEAMAKIRTEFEQKGLKLVLTGGCSAAEAGSLDSQLKELKIEHLVVRMGFLTHNRVKLLVQGSEFLVFPSLFEGFGMPVIEAMQLNCPVISSTAGSLSEICANSALMFNPTEVEQLTMILRDVVDRKIDREKLIQRGTENAKRYSWQGCFDKTLQVYNQVFNE